MGNPPVNSGEDMRTVTPEALTVLRRDLTRPTIPLFYANAWRRKLMWRLFGLRLWRAGALTLSEALRNCLLPQHRKRDVDLKILPAVKHNAAAILKERAILPREWIRWGQHPFYRQPGNDPLEAWFWVFQLLTEIVLSDQYHLERFVTRDAVIFDAGANIGVFSIFAARMAPAGRIFAFEPFGRTYETLRRNVAPYPNIRPVRKALGREAEEEKIMIPDNLTAAGCTLADSGIPMAAGVPGVERVRLTSVDAFVRDLALERVDFIKMDVEGYEERVLRGAADTIRRFHPVLAMSAYHKSDDLEVLPRTLREIEPRYRLRLCRDAEMDLICRVP